MEKRLYRFSAEKNAALKEARGIDFDDVIFCLENGGLLDTINNKGPQYPHQKIFVVDIDHYAYAAPFVENNSEFFLKTLFPSRKLTKYYLGDVS